MSLSPTKSKKAGRPATGRVRVVIYLVPAEKDRLDKLRGTIPRGPYLGKLIAAQPDNPFQRFIALQKCPPSASTRSPIS